MRSTINWSPTLGVVPIEDIEIDVDSRDDIPRVLRALQEIWSRRRCRDQILQVIQDQVGAGVRQDTGRPGMSYWMILVLSLLKQALNIDFDRLTELANQHEGLRQMLQVDLLDGQKIRFTRQAIINNVSLVHEESWQRINATIIAFGYAVLAPTQKGPQQVSCDSYVVETEIRFPMDVRLLYDATRTFMKQSSKAWAALLLPLMCTLTGWRQLGYLTHSLYLAYRRVGSAKQYRSNPKAVKAYLKLCTLRINKCLALEALVRERFPDSGWVHRLQTISAQAQKLHEQVRLRLVEKKVIPNEEKIYSLHAPHTRWIRKGKARPKEVELGVPVTISQCTLGLILWWKIMWEGVDVDITEEVVKQITARFPKVHTISFDRGFSSQENLEAIQSLVEHPVLPKKGRRNQADRARESTPEFKKARKQHVLIESRINCLEHHGGDRVRTKGGKDGFARTVAASIVATNLCQIGKCLMKRDQKRLRRAA